jgi:formamidopyrimidine-DNA glycosylase
MVRGIRAAVEGRRIAAVSECPNDCRPLRIEPAFPEFARRQAGQTVTAVRRIAKRVVLDLSDGAHVAIEPRMTGLVLLHDAPDAEHLRIEWQFAGRREFNRLWFWDRRGLGVVRWHAPGSLARELGPEKLGPDALALTLAELQARCRATRREIKVALLDQRLIAGIGNLYASEILHLAGIHPARPAARLTRAMVNRLAHAMRAVLEEAIRYEGSTLGDGTYRNALNKSGGYQNAHRVYARQGERCPTCGRGVIQRIVQAQRSTFFCPRCQRRK